MTEQQYNTLTQHKHILDTYNDVRTVNTAHPAAQAINGVYTEIFGQPINMSCANCFIDGLQLIYNLYNEQAK